MNRWLDSLGYDPSHKGAINREAASIPFTPPETNPTPSQSASSSSTGSASSGPANQSPSGNKHPGTAAIVYASRLQMVSILVLMVCSLTTALAQLYTLRVIQKSNPIRDRVPAEQSGKPHWDALKLERTPNQAGSEALMKEADAGRVARKTALQWNTGHRVFAYGPTDNSKAKYYFPMPRPSHEDEFDQLQAELEHAKLYHVGIPPSWSQHRLQTALSQWSAACHVDPELIKSWSSFRETPGSEAENECKPGGVCHIVSRDCDSRAMKDSESTSQSH